MIEARDLEKKDIGFLKKGSADPFVVVKSEFLKCNTTKTLQQTVPFIAFYLFASL